MSSAAAPGRIPPETSSSWSLRKNPRDSALLVPEWSVPCNPLNWEEPQDAYDGAALRDRQGRHAHLHKDIQATHPNRGKVEKKLAGPGFSKITKSYSTKFKDDPDPYNQVTEEPRPLKRTILHEVQDARRAGKFRAEHKSSFHPLYAYRCCRYGSREDSHARLAPLPFSDRVDMKTMGNKTWTSLAGTGLPAAEKFSVPKVGEFSELVGQGKGKVGNRVGESPLSYKTAFKKNEQRTMKNGKPFESRSRFAQTRSGYATGADVLAPCEADQPGLNKTRWPELMLRPDPPVKEARGTAGKLASLQRDSTSAPTPIQQRTMRPSQSSLLEVGGGGPSPTATFRSKGRAARPPVHIPPKLM